MGVAVGVGFGVGAGVGVGVATGVFGGVAVGAGGGVGVGPAAAGVVAAGAFDTAGDWVLPGALTPSTPESGEAAVGLALDAGGAVDPPPVGREGEVLADGLRAALSAMSATP